MGELTGGAAEGAGFGPQRRRRAVRLSPESLVRTGYLDGGREFPLVVEPNAEAVNLVSWAAGQRDWVEAELLRHEAILFRGFDLDSQERFEQFARAVAPELRDNFLASHGREPFQGPRRILVAMAELYTNEEL